MKFSAVQWMREGSQVRKRFYWERTLFWGTWWFRCLCCAASHTWS